MADKGDIDSVNRAILRLITNSIQVWEHSSRIHQRLLKKVVIRGRITLSPRAGAKTRF